MRKVILYIAVSLDGYIADGKGAVDWIGGHDENVEMGRYLYTILQWRGYGHYGKKDLQPNCDRTFTRPMAL